MLFKQTQLAGIRSGKITLAFRKWKKPTVKSGTLLKTAIGQVEIKEVKPWSLARITSRDATLAGYETKELLLETLSQIEKGEVYRIKLRYHSPDPRIALRKQSTLTADEVSILKSKLDRLDKNSLEGPWTIRVLTAIVNHKGLRAEDLARKLGYEKMWLKTNVRKLKNLGLTISLEVGYEISSLGKVLLKELKRG
ncbi:MAG: hypothetical protein AB7O48_17180 [Cyclobacteriaceae bacterium]